MGNGEGGGTRPRTDLKREKKRKELLTDKESSTKKKRITYVCRRNKIRGRGGNSSQKGSCKLGETFKEGGKSQASSGKKKRGKRKKKRASRGEIKKRRKEEKMKDYHEEKGVRVGNSFSTNGESCEKE